MMFLHLSGWVYLNRELWSLTRPGGMRMMSWHSGPLSGELIPFQLLREVPISQ